ARMGTDIEAGPGVGGGLDARDGQEGGGRLGGDGGACLVAVLVGRVGAAAGNDDDGAQQRQGEAQAHAFHHAREHVLSHFVVDRKGRYATTLLGSLRKLFCEISSNAVRFSRWWLSSHASPARSDATASARSHRTAHCAGSRAWAHPLGSR